MPYKPREKSPMKIVEPLKLIITDSRHHMIDSSSMKKYQ